MAWRSATQFELADLPGTPEQIITTLIRVSETHVYNDALDPT